MVSSEGLAATFHKTDDMETRPAVLLTITLTFNYLDLTSSSSS